MNVFKTYSCVYGATEQDGKSYDEGKLATAEQLAQADAAGADASSLIGTKDGAESARLTALATLASLKANLGSLDRITSLVKTLGLVNATPEFQDHVTVINGFSNVMRDVFGDEIGIGARSAIGQVRSCSKQSMLLLVLSVPLVPYGLVAQGSLPFNIPVEVETIWEFKHID